jgi:polysaccharide pyruvyl transferase WcaK-like protein
MSTQRVVISNVFDDSNRGGTAITSVAIELIEARLPRAEIILVPVLTSDASIGHTHRHVTELHPSVAIAAPLVRERRGRVGRLLMTIESLLILVGVRGRRSPTVASIRGAALVVGKGGQVFRMRRGAGPLLAFWMDVLPLVLAQRHGVSTAVFSVTVGPYRDKSLAARLASMVLSRVDLVVVRDARSADAARGLGVPPERIRLAPDSVFAIEPPSDSRTESDFQHVGRARRFGVVTVLPWEDFDDVAKVVVATMKSVLDEGLVDEILVVMQTSEDREATQRLVRVADDNRVRAIFDDMTPAELTALYADARFVVAGRTHSAILALVAGTPAHPIRPRGLEKASEILDLLGLADLVCVVDEAQRPLSASTNHLVDLLRRDCNDDSALRRRVRAATQAAREEVERAADDLTSLLV